MARLSPRTKGKEIAKDGSSDSDLSGFLDCSYDEELARRLTEEQTAEEDARVAADAALAQRLALEEAGDAGVSGNLVEL